ncbi:hypothetical protein LCM4579_27760 [Ensifer sp. LCM 4579]|nr:hypothetical protein LCM4579_27760 [Ensifer sp. LCM 4579]
MPNTAIIRESGHSPEIFRRLDSELAFGVACLLHVSFNRIRIQGENMQQSEVLQRLLRARQDARRYGGKAAPLRYFLRKPM